MNNDKYAQYYSELENDIRSGIENVTKQEVQGIVQDAVIDKLFEILQGQGGYGDSQSQIIGFLTSCSEFNQLDLKNASKYLKNKGELRKIVENNTSKLNEITKSLDEIVNIGGDFYDIIKSLSDKAYNGDLTSDGIAKIMNSIFDISSNLMGIFASNPATTIFSFEIELGKALLNVGVKICQKHANDTNATYIYGILLEENTLIAKKFGNVWGGKWDDIDNTLTAEETKQIINMFKSEAGRENIDIGFLNEYLKYREEYEQTAKELGIITAEIEQFLKDGKDYFEKNFIDLAANDDGLKEIVTPIYMNGLINKDDIDKISVRLSDVNNKNNKVIVNQNSINNATNTAPVRADPIILDLNGDGIYSKNITDGTNFDFAGRRITA